MTAFSLRARLHFGANSDLALSLPQSNPLNPERLDSFAPSPLAARASAIRSRTCGRQRLAASLYPPPAALESQTPQREARRLPPQSIDLALLSKFGVNAIPWSRIQPLSLAAQILNAAIQLPFNKERSSVIYRGKGGKAACVWCKASNTECCAAKPHKHLA